MLVRDGVPREVTGVASPLLMDGGPVSELQDLISDHQACHPPVILKGYIDAGTPFSLGCAKFGLIFLPILSSTSTLDRRLSG